MKRLKKNSVAIALAAASLPLLMGCGSQNGSGSSIGYIPGSVVGGVGSCIPVNAYGTNAQIPFTGSNAQFTPLSIRAGKIPSSATNEPYAGQTFGTTVMGGSVTGGPYQKSNMSGDTISMNIQPGAYAQPYQPYPTTYPTYPTTYPTQTSNAAINGFVTLGSGKLQEIAYFFGNGGYQQPYSPYNPYAPMPTMPQSTACISGIAMNLGVQNSQLFGGNVYLYLNNSQNGVSIWF